MTEAQDIILGKQAEGWSSDSVKEMALRALQTVPKQTFNVMADIGAGSGILTKMLLPYCDQIYMLDDYAAPIQNDKILYRSGDLNASWQLDNESVDFVFSLEVVEHIENPRFFFREVRRILRKGGYGFVSTPNNNNFFSKINFLFKGTHRFFQDSCYPAHISALFKVDLIRILR